MCTLYFTHLLLCCEQTFLVAAVYYHTLYFYSLGSFCSFLCLAFVTLCSLVHFGSPPACLSLPLPPFVTLVVSCLRLLCSHACTIHMPYPLPLPLPLLPHTPYHPFAPSLHAYTHYICLQFLLFTTCILPPYHHSSYYLADPLRSPTAPLRALPTPLRYMRCLYFTRYHARAALPFTRTPHTHHTHFARTHTAFMPYTHYRSWFPFAWFLPPPHTRTHILPPVFCAFTLYATPPFYAHIYLPATFAFVHTAVAVRFTTPPYGSSSYTLPAVKLTFIILHTITLLPCIPCCLVPPLPFALHTIVARRICVGFLLLLVFYRYHTHYIAFTVLYLPLPCTLLYLYHLYHVAFVQFCTFPYVMQLFYHALFTFGSTFTFYFIIYASTTTTAHHTIWRYTSLYIILLPVLLFYACLPFVRGCTGIQDAVHLRCWTAFGPRLTVLLLLRARVSAQFAAGAYSQFCIARAFYAAGLPPPTPPLYLRVPALRFARFAFYFDAVSRATPRTHARMVRHLSPTTAARALPALAPPAGYARTHLPAHFCGLCLPRSDVPSRTHACGDTHAWRGLYRSMRACAAMRRAACWFL